MELETCTIEDLRKLTVCTAECLVELLEMQADIRVIIVTMLILEERLTVLRQRIRPH